MSLKIADAFCVGLAAWLGGELEGTAAAAVPVVAAGDGVSAPCPGVVVAARKVDRVPGMEYTGRVGAVVVLRTSLDDTPPEVAREWAAVLEGRLRSVPVKTEDVAGVWLHDFRREDSAEGVDDRERVTGWPVSSMVSLVG